MSRFPRPSESNPSAPTPAACPTALELASWCDGALEGASAGTDGAVIDRMGAIALHVASCASCRAIVRDMHDECAKLETSAAEEIALDHEQLARVIARANELVAAPAPLRFPAHAGTASAAARGGGWRTAIAAAASIAAAFGGWHAASSIVGRGAVPGASAGDPTLVASAKDGAGSGTAGASSAASAANATAADSDADDLSQLLTFGLFDEFTNSEIVDTTQRSDS